MSFNGLNAGGLSHYGDLIAQGMRDQIELQRQNQQLAQQMQTQQLNNAIKVQRAAQQTGLYANSPSALQAAGGNLVPLGAGAPSQAPAASDDEDDDAPQASAASPAPNRAPAIQAPDDEDDEDEGAGGSSVASDTSNPDEDATTDVDKNAMMNTNYQQALTHLATRAPQGMADPQTGWVHPYIAQQAMQLAKQKTDNDLELQKAALVDQGKTKRVMANIATGLGGRNNAPAQKALLDNLHTLNQEEIKLVSNPYVGADAKAAQLADISARRSALTSQLGGASVPPKAPKKVLASKQYSKARNQTKLTYVDGSSEVVNGQL